MSALWKKPFKNSYIRTAHKEWKGNKNIIIKYSLYVLEAVGNINSLGNRRVPYKSTSIVGTIKILRAKVLFRNPMDLFYCSHSVKLSSLINNNFVSKLRILYWVIPNFSENQDPHIHN